MSRKLIIRKLKRKCSVPMCTGTSTNIIARTTMPGKMVMGICDACLSEAYALRYPGAISKQEALAMQEGLDAANAKIAELTADPPAAPQAEAQETPQPDTQAAPSNKKTKGAKK